MTVKRPQKTISIFLCAGESSGDQIGALLMQALKKKNPHADFHFFGVGGALMQQEGLSVHVPLSQLSVLGVWDALVSFLRLKKIVNQLVSLIQFEKPSVVVTIDFPGFNFMLGKSLKKKLKKSIPHVHVVAPTVWAWRAGRAQKISRFLDHLLTLFSFEPKYFTSYGLPTTWMGHPLVELGLDQGSAQDFFKRHGVAPQTPVILMLPGSRPSELKRHVPIFLQVLKKLEAQQKPICVVIPTLPALKQEMIHQVMGQGGEKVQCVVIAELKEKKDAYQAAQASLVASGTATLELALAGVPMVMTYRTSWLNGWIARLFIRTRLFCLVNILLGRQVVPELLQKNCAPDALYQAVQQIMNDPESRQAQKQAFESLAGLICPREGKCPSEIGAQVIQRYL